MRKIISSQVLNMNILAPPALGVGPGQSETKQKYALAQIKHTSTLHRYIEIFLTCISLAVRSKIPNEQHSGKEEKSESQPVQRQTTKLNLFTVFVQAVRQPILLHKIFNIYCTLSTLHDLLYACPSLQHPESHQDPQHKL